ncbi:MAG TPA: acylglycerol kinase family protein, partial [Vicinamibacterales bacterium]|nr:acylglycerol kinase family protein [Vicinamibacterales bacterium]
MSHPGGRGITVILNSTAGSADGSPRSRIEQAFARAQIAAEVRTVTGPEVRAAAERAAADGSTLVAAGGDGTVSTVASVAAAAGVTFGVVPLGTLNHFAKDAGIPLDVDEAAQAIAAGFTRALDIGAV